MLISTPSEETLDTSVATHPTQAPETPAPEDPGKPEPSPAPVDWNKVIDSDDEDEKPAPAVDPALGSAPDETTPAPARSFKIKYGEREEAVEEAQVVPRLQEARHLKQKWETEVAPLMRVVKGNPLLAQALADAARGDESSVRRAIESLQTKAPTENGPSKERTPKDYSEEIAALRDDPQFGEYSDDELVRIMALQDKRTEVESRRALARQAAEEQEISAERTRYFDALGTIHPDRHVEVMEAMPRVLAQIRSEAGEEAYGNLVRMIKNPRLRGPNGQPYLATFYNEIRAGLDRKPATAGGPPVGHKEPAPGAPRSITATLEPGTITNQRSSGRPDYRSMTAQQRAEHFNRLIDGD